MYVIIPGGKLAIVSVLFAGFLLATWTIVALTSSKQCLKNFTDISNSRRYHTTKHVDVSKLTRLSGDRKTLVVTSEEALPNAFEFLRLNMHLPIQKIVLLKSGANDTVRIYPIPRDGIIGLGENSLTLTTTEIGLIILFLIFIIGSFAYIFTSISGTRVYWDEESWLNNNNELCLDANELSCDEELLEETTCVKAERKRREIENV